MKINAILYKEMSDAAEPIQLETGKSLKEQMPDIDFSHRIIINNGKVTTANHKVKESDHIIIRSTPSGVVAAVVAIIVVAVAVAVVVGVMLYNKRKAAAKKQTRENSDEKDEVQNRPFLKGSTNAVATSKTQPYFIGENLFTPYVMNSGGNAYKGFSTISGVDGVEQFYNVVLEGGFNKQVFKKLFCDDVVLKTFSENTPQEGVFDFDEDSVFYDTESKIEIAQDGAPFTTDILNYKIVEQQSNNALPKSDDEHYAPLIFTLEKKSMAANICITFNGLIAYTDEGYKRDRTVVVVPYYSLDNGATWTGFAFNQNGAPNNSFTRRTLNQIRFVAHIDFAWEQVKDLDNPVLLKVECNTASYDGSCYDECYVEWVQSYVYDADKSTSGFVAEKVIDTHEALQSTLIGLRIKSTADNEDKLTKINFVSSGVARIYNAETDTWPAEKVPTSNPAAWLIEVMTSDSHKPSKTADEEIDFASFAELYQYCEEQEYRIDMVLTDGQTKQSLLADICNVCDAMLYQDIYGKIAVAIDTYKPNAVALFNSQNIINIEYNKEFSRETDGIKITYVNREADFVEDTYLVMKDGKTRTADSILREMPLKGITTHKHVVKNARRLMATAELRPSQVTIEVGKEGVYFTPLSKILIQNNELKIGLGHAEIKAVIVQGANIIGLELYEPIEYDSADENGFGVVINAVGADYCTPLALAYTAQTNGRVNEILFTRPIPRDAERIPHAGDVLSYGYLNNGAFDTITSPFLIYGLEPTSKGYKMPCVNYDEAVYDSGTIPAYTPNLTQPRTAPQKLPERSDTKDLLNEFSASLIDGSKNVGAPDVVSNIMARAGQDTIEISCNGFTLGLKNSIESVKFELQKGVNAEWEEVEISAGLSATYTFNRQTDGYLEAETLSLWRIRAKAKNIYGNESEEYGYTYVDVSSYGTWQIQTPVVDEPIVQDRTVILQFKQPSRGDNKKVYGNIQHRVEIMRPAQTVAGVEYEADTQYYKPNSRQNPYDREVYYKDGNGYITCGNVYSQTLPLIGQEENNAGNTTYTYRICATNDAGVSSYTTVTITALCSSLRDIVNANAEYARLYVPNLSAISANLGEITQGSLSGNDNNYWALSTTENHNSGEMRVGGNDQYLKIEATEFDPFGRPTNYKLVLVTDNFDVLTESTKFNKEIIVYNSITKLDRTRITPAAVYIEHRDNPNADWFTVARFDSSGAMAPSYRAKDQILIGNFTQTQLRRNAHDIGRKYLSSDGLVWHFDNDILAQDGNAHGLTIEGVAALKGAEDSNGIDFTPALPALAPYCVEARCLYGQCSLALSTASATELFTCEFWLQYLYAENQQLFSVGSENETVAVIISSQEPYAVVSGVVAWQDENETITIYTQDRNPSQSDYVYLTAEACAAGGESLYTVTEIVTNSDYTVKSIQVSGALTGIEYNYISGDPDCNFETFAPEIVWGEDSSLMNRTAEAINELIHTANGTEERVDLESLGVTLTEYEWLHVGVIITASEIHVLFGTVQKTFSRGVTGSAVMNVLLNPDETSIIIDELYIDTVAEDVDDFKTVSLAPIPWAAIGKDEDAFIFDAKDPSKVKSNILEHFLTTDEFKNAVLAAIAEQ